MTTLTILTATAAMAALAGLWWIRRTNLAVYPVGRAPRELRPLPAGCELGAQLMAATDVTSSPGTTPAPGGGTMSRPGGGGAPPPSKPPKRKKDTVPSRRTFLRNAFLVGNLGVLSAMGGASLAFLWPNLRGGFGAELDIDDAETILAEIRANRAPFEYPAGRMYLVEYDPALDPGGEYADVTDGGASPVMAIYQKCVHLGCKVPWCLSAQWYQCPCHGSNYNRWGEYELGPAPRGLDRFATRVVDGRVLVDTGEIITGPGRNAGVLEQPQEGPSCV